MDLTFKEALKYVLFGLAVLLQHCITGVWAMLIWGYDSAGHFDHITKLAFGLWDYRDCLIFTTGLYIIWSLEYFMVLRNRDYQCKQPKWFAWACPVLLPMPLIQMLILLGIIYHCIPDIYLYK